MSTLGGDGKAWDRDGDPGWDAEFADCLIGSTVLVGLTVMHRNGTLKGQEQLHGVIASVDRMNGIEVALTGLRSGETYWLHPTFPLSEPPIRASTGSDRLVR